MPKFTLIKHPDCEGDAKIEIEFTTDLLSLANDHYRDFLKASGFELPIEDDKLDEEIDFFTKEEDWMWDDAFDFKFKEQKDAVSQPNLYAISLGDK